MALSKTKVGIAINDGVKNAKDYGVVGDGSADDTTAIQALLDARGNIRFPAGSYKYTAPLKFYQNTRIVGAHRGSVGGTNFVCSYASSAYPIQIDGALAPDSANWVYNLDMEDIYFDASGWSGSATHFMNLKAAYSCAFNRVTVDGVATAKKAVRVSKVNHIDLNTFRLFRSGSTKINTGFDVLDTDGEINGLVFRNCDFEICATGIKFTGSTYKIIANVMNHYAEFSDIYIDWNASQVESNLAVIGGTILQDTGSTGVKIRQSNCSVIGLSTSSSGTYAVDIAGASSHNNCHVIGGTLRAGVNDPSKYLTTNNTGTANGAGDLRGRVTFGGATTAAVSFDYGLDTNTYYVAISAADSKTYWVTAKTTAGFTLNASSASSASVDWMVRN